MKAICLRLFFLLYLSKSRTGKTRTEHEDIILPRQLTLDAYFDLFLSNYTIEWDTKFWRTAKRQSNITSQKFVNFTTWCMQHYIPETILPPYSSGTALVERIRKNSLSEHISETLISVKPSNIANTINYYCLFKKHNLLLHAYISLAYTETKHSITRIR